MISGIGVTVQPSWVYKKYIIGITSTGIQNDSNDFFVLWYFNAIVDKYISVYYKSGHPPVRIQKDVENPPVVDHFRRETIKIPHLWKRFPHGTIGVSNWDPNNFLTILYGHLIGIVLNRLKPTIVMID